MKLQTNFFSIFSTKNISVFSPVVWLKTQKNPAD